MKIKNFTETRYLSPSSLYSLCNEHNYYTRGDCAAYDAMLNMPKDENGDSRPMTDEDLARIAEDIFNHSDVSGICGDWGISEHDLMQSILYDVIEACYITLEFQEV